jgi:hypothetical protein
MGNRHLRRSGTRKEGLMHESCAAGRSKIFRLTLLALNPHCAHADGYIPSLSSTANQAPVTAFPRYQIHSPGRLVQAVEVHTHPDAGMQPFDLG